MLIQRRPLQIDSFKGKKPNDWGTEASVRSEGISGKIKCQLLNNLAERENISYGEWMISKQNSKWSQAVGNRKK